MCVCVSGREVGREGGRVLLVCAVYTEWDGWMVGWMVKRQD